MDYNYIVIPLLLLLFSGLCDDTTITLSTPDEQWQKINISSAENYCLQQAKEQVLGGAFLVYNCKCAPNENYLQKSYDCTVNAADGEHGVNISCIKKSRYCIVTSEIGVQQYSFDELEQSLD
ncbi:hypothetical protein KKB44_05465 [Candidatus Micrarchaeota archaeon]|nr:hypothetical protein [Candidatus Micrarchaeota archaeon]